ncbi:unnamed protein product [Chrysoparadoxa australica]
MTCIRHDYRADELSSTAPLSPENGNTLGIRMPSFSLGTFGIPREKVEESVYTALRMGYLGIDIAAVCDINEEAGRGIRRALDDGLITRDRLFVTMKFWMTDYAEKNVRPAVERLLRELKLSYFDCLAMNWPVAWDAAKGDVRALTLLPDSSHNFVNDETVLLSQTWSAMEELVKSGQARSIAVANFSISELKKLFIHSQMKPAFDQVECHPYLQQDQMKSFLQAQGMPMVAYGVLGIREEGQDGESPMNDPIINKIAYSHNKTPAQESHPSLASSMRSFPEH